MTERTLRNDPTSGEPPTKRPAFVPRWGTMTLIGISAASASALLAAVAFLGWLVGASALSAFGSEFIPMAPATSLFFVIAASITFGLLTVSSSRGFRKVALPLSSLSFGLATLNLLKSIGLIDTGFESFLVPNPESFGHVLTGRMSPLTAFNFALDFAAVAILCQTRWLHERKHDVAGLLVFTAAAVTFSVLFSYVAGRPLLYGANAIPMALTTGLGFIMLDLSIVCKVGSRHFPLKLLMGNSARGRLVRVFLPVVVLSMVLQEILGWLVQRHGGINNPIIALVPSLLVLVVGGLVVLKAADRIGTRFESDLYEEQLSKEKAHGERDSIFTLCLDLVCVLEEGQIVDLNHTVWGKTLGFPGETLIGSGFRYLIHEDDLDTAMAAYDRAIAGERPAEHTSRIKTRSGHYLWFHWRMARIPDSEKIIATIRDVTDIKNTTQSLLNTVNIRTNQVVQLSQNLQEEHEKYEAKKEELHHAQKLEAVGTLAGGVAHEFNNLLHGISGYLRFAVTEIPAENPAVSDIESAQLAVRRASDLTRQLLTFSRKSEPDRETVEVDDLINDVAKMLQRILSEDIELEYEPPQSPLAVFADSNLIHQALVNLCINARDAMPHGGRLEILVTEAVLGEADVHGREGMQPGSFVRISVSDTGVGIPDSELPRIFDPFHTTKEVGKGTGLGLSTVYGIVEQHNGKVQVSSHVGLGTGFDLYFPRATEKASTEPARTDTGPAHSGGGATILIAEDEKIVRDVAVRSLTATGYHVLEAKDGEVAVDIFAEHADEIDLVILDAVMPRTNGRNAYWRMAEIRADLPVIFCSGYDSYANASVSELVDAGYILFQKPYETEALIKQVQEKLERRSKPYETAS